MIAALFELPDSPSPRLTWMETHGIETNRAYVETDDWPVECPETGATVLPWIAWKGGANPTPDNSEQGMTEIEALDKLARKLNLPLWNQ